MNQFQQDTIRRVLVIDDNEAIHHDFKTILSRPATAGDLSADEALLFGDTKKARNEPVFSVDFASQGQQGYEKVVASVATGNPYHLAFVDMRMPPGWDGVQTIQKLWEADPRLQVVICSAYSAYSWKEIAEKLGSSDRLLILKKPFDELEVFQIASSLTAKWLATRQAEIKLSEMEGLVTIRTAELKHAALVDRLTGLANRELLNDRLSQLLESSRRDANRKFAVLFLDIDRFKVINDSLGHEIGDLLIIEIAERLKQETRRSDTVASISTTARLGGDEFIVVLDQLRDYRDAVRVTERLIVTLSQPYEIRGHTIHSTASIGITTNRIQYASPTEMLRDADTAMYRAKGAGKACCMLFDREMHQDAVKRLTLENDLREAIAKKQFVLYYQPIVSMSDCATVALETLVRWNHPERGLVPPAEFIPLAEEIGMIVPLGNWVLAESCRQLGEWRKCLPEFAAITLSVNLSRKQLAFSDLVASIERAIQLNGLKPADLKLEITESAIMEDPEDAVRVLHEIRRTNVELHMDDFGTGYSSLSCLHRFPIGGLKIDRSFISQMAKRKDFATVIDAIIALTHKLGLRLVAEGVETEEQFSLLKAMGCKLAQGYLFAKPLSVADLERFVAVGTSSIVLHEPRSSAA